MITPFFVRLVGNFEYKSILIVAQTTGDARTPIASPLPLNSRLKYCIFYRSGLSFDVWYRVSNRSRCIFQCHRSVGPRVDQTIQRHRPEGNTQREDVQPVVGSQPGGDSLSRCSLRLRAVSERRHVFSGPLQVLVPLRCTALRTVVRTQ